VSSPWRPQPKASPGAVGHLMSDAAGLVSVYVIYGYSV
jgi:hypothetical protein